MLHHQSKGHVRRSDREGTALAEIGQKLEKKALVDW